MRLSRVVLACLLELSVCAFSVLGQSGYKQIRIGSSISAIPFPCTKADVICEGSYDSQWLRIYSTGDVIQGIDIIFTGKSLNDSRLEVPSITLAQAVQLHSMQKGFKSPTFITATNVDGIAYGLVDISNDIVYATVGTDPSSRVSEVSYVENDAPILQGDAFSPSAGATLTQAAKTSNPYISASSKIIVPIPSSPPPQNSLASTRHEAIDGVIERSDKAIGSGNMALALIEQVSTWYEVDKENSVAISKSDQLKLMYPDFQLAWNSLILYADTNKTLLQKGDLGQIPYDLKTEIDRKMRQLEAMGFSQY